MVKQLNEEQYLSTMGNKMNNVTESARTIGKYLELCKAVIKK